MSQAKDAFLDFGGHSMSGGFSVSHDKVHLLENELSLACSRLKNNNESLAKKISVDKKLSLDDVNWKTYETIEKLAPFGVGNPKPVFLFDKVTVSDFKLFGKEKNHLEITFKNNKGGKVSAIAFFADDKSFNVPVKKGATTDLVATMEKSTFRGSAELRLRIVGLF